MLVDINTIIPTHSQLQIITFHFIVILPLKEGEETIICACSQDELKGSFHFQL